MEGISALDRAGQAGLVAMIAAFVPGSLVGRTWLNLVPDLFHWNTKASAVEFSPSELNSTWPCTVFSVTPLCR